jgi:hypothetical protein
MAADVTGASMLSDLLARLREVPATPSTIVVLPPNPNPDLLHLRIDAADDFVVRPLHVDDGNWESTMSWIHRNSRQIDTTHVSSGGLEPNADEAFSSIRKE